MFKGSITALVTPFTRGGLIDEKALRRLVEYHVKSGTSGLVPCGTTGESPTLSHDEHRRVIEVVIEQTAGRLPVIAGTGSNCTDEAVSLTKHAEAAGATGALLIAPYYNRPTQKGLYEHFKRIAAKTSLPLVLYNHQGRTGVTIEPETIKNLSDAGNFVAVKDASGGIDYTAKTLDLTGGKVGVLSGNDSWTLSLMALGASGVISVVANIAPKGMAGMVAEFLNGNAEKARQMHYKLLPLMKAMDLEVNPVPVKTAMAEMGMIEPGLRLPLTPMDSKNLKKLKAVLKEYNLLKA